MTTPRRAKRRSATRAAPRRKPPAPAELAARLAAVREAGHTCREIARLTGAEGDGPGSEFYKRAGRLDRLTRTGAARDEELSWLLPVLDRIEAGLVPVFPRVSHKLSKRSEAVYALKAATTERTLAGKDKLINEALRLLNAA